jgi:hypothetical protein
LSDALSLDGECRAGPAALGLVLPVSAFAAEVRSGGTVTVGPDEVVNDDLYAFGTNVLVQGIVGGDVIAAGATVSVTGRVTGSVMAAGNSVTVNGGLFVVVLYAALLVTGYNTAAGRLGIAAGACGSH